MISDEVAKSSGANVLQKVRCQLTSAFSEKESLLFIVGLALFYAWNLSDIYGHPIASLFIGSEGLETSTLVSGICNTLSYTLIALFFYRLRQFQRISLIAACIAGTTILVTYVFSFMSLVDSQMLQLIYRGVCRVCAAWVIVAWGARYSQLDTLRITIFTLAAFLISFAIYLLISLSDGFLRILLFAVLLPLSMVLLNRARTVSTAIEPPEAFQKFFNITWRVILTFFLFGIVTWIAILNTQSDAAQGAFMGPFVVIGSSIVILILFVLALLFESTFSNSYIYKLVFPMIMVGSLLVAVFSFQSLIGPALISIGYTCFDLFCFVLFANACHQTGVCAERAFGWCRAIESSVPLFTLGGLAFAHQVFGIGEDIFAYLFCVLCVIVIIVVVALDRTGVFEKSHLNPSIEYPRAEMLHFAYQCETVIERCGLSSREAEIMSLIVRGRSVPHIAERLLISRSTVKTHITHIYMKLGVNDRQEMIDMIEGTSIEPEE